MKQRRQDRDLTAIIEHKLIVGQAEHNTVVAPRASASPRSSLSETVSAFEWVRKHASCTPCRHPLVFERNDADTAWDVACGSTPRASSTASGHDEALLPALSQDL
jgi:hypothetical protein